MISFHCPAATLLSFIYLVRLREAQHSIWSHHQRDSFTHFLNYIGDSEQKTPTEKKEPTWIRKKTRKIMRKWNSQSFSPYLVYLMDLFCYVRLPGNFSPPIKFIFIYIYRARAESQGEKSAQLYIYFCYFSNFHIHDSRRMSKSPKKRKDKYK